MSDVGCRVKPAIATTAHHDRNPTSEIRNPSSPVQQVLFTYLQKATERFLKLLFKLGNGFLKVERYLGHTVTHFLPSTVFMRISKSSIKDWFFA